MVATVAVPENMAMVVVETAMEQALGIKVAMPMVARPRPAQSDPDSATPVALVAEDAGRSPGASSAASVVDHSSVLLLRELATIAE